ncbi:MAG: ATP-dependent RNA helicase HrpA, partial [Pseudomonadota bacterium]
HPVVIISGETGSGKTTQIPKFCLEAGRGIDGMIGCTQPRRIAAITISHRISEELGEEPGKSVGYKIRFNDKTGKNTFIKIMTDGILLAEAHSNLHLWAYDTIIVDEAHERSLNIDFLLGILKKLLAKRKDLKLIIASATIDTEKFSKSFGNAPIIEVSGRMHPVTVRYFETLSQTVPREEETHIDMSTAAVEAIIRKNHPGDMLVFMPTEQDIRETCELLEGRSFGNVSILPLYARLSADEQKRVFAPLPQRKIIVATNVAETSITIPGIRYVVDTGLARISHYSPGTRTTSLPVVPVSRSSADQRKGRCGRVEHGICIRLFSEEDYLSRPLYTPPEILRSNLAEVILRMIAQGLGDVCDFPFIDAPPKKSIQDGYDLLTDLGAIEKKNSPNGFVLTKDGRLMARIPVDPRISRMLIEAKREGCMRQVIVIASALSIQDPRERPAEKEEEAKESRRIFEDPSSDFMTIIHIWNGYHDDAGETKGSAKLKKFCRKHFLSFRRMREWQDIHDQIAEILIETGMLDKDVISPEDGGSVADNTLLYEAVHKSVLSGFLSNIAVKKEKNIYKAAKEKEVMLFPGSGLFNKGGRWIVASEMIETTRRFARTAANIDPSWLEQIGEKQCRYSYLNPHWSTTRQEVMSLEQVRLFGLVIEAGRLVPFGAVDPKTACSVFIREALIKNGLKKPFPFILHNSRIMEAIKDLENKLRRRDLTAGEEAVFTFYQKRLQCVFDTPSLEKAIAKAGFDHFLRMSMEDLIVRMPDPEEISLFPEAVSLSGSIFPLTYRFHPGEEDDGITVSIPLSVIPIIPKEPLEYLVPGLFREKVKTLIKGLPREWRKKLMPITETVETVVAQTQIKDQPLINFISDILHHHLNVDIPAEAWPLSTLPPHLNMRIDITGPDGKPIRSGRAPDILCYKPGLLEKNRALAPFECEKKKMGKNRNHPLGFWRPSE